MFCDICHAKMVRFTADLHQCPHDGLISSHLKPNMAIYDKSYHEKHKKYAHSELDAPLQEVRVGFVLKNVPEVERGFILDFGCGSGAFLRALDGHFGHKHGFDINPYEDFPRIDYLLQEYNVVTMWDVIEHLESPSSFLKGIKTDYIFLTTPCIDDIDYINKMTEWRHYRLREHLHYYNLKSLSALLESCGFTPIDYTYDESTVRRGGGEKNLISICGKRV